MGWGGSSSQVILASESAGALLAPICKVQAAYAPGGSGISGPARPLEGESDLSGLSPLVPPKPSVLRVESSPPPSQEQKRHTAQTTSFSKTLLGEDREGSLMFLLRSPGLPAWPSWPGEPPGTPSDRKVLPPGRKLGKTGFPPVGHRVLGSAISGPGTSLTPARALPGLNLFKGHSCSQSLQNHLTESLKGKKPVVEIRCPHKYRQVLSAWEVSLGGETRETSWRRKHLS